MGIHQQTWHDDFGAGQSGRGGSGGSSRESGGSGAGGGSGGRSGPSGFGRGWIPLERDIGIQGEDLPSAYPAVAPAEAGAYPDSRRQSYAHLLGEGSDGPLPAQGRRDGDAGPHGNEEREGDEYANPYHFTPSRRAAFLHHLAEDGNVRKACAAVGISSQAAYLARRRDRVFRSGWAAALVVARECVAQVLATRAIEGTRETVFYRGEVIGQRVRYDTRLLLAHHAQLDGRAEDAVAEAHAERFDEILALVAGEGFPEEMADEPAVSYDNGRFCEADPLLPMERWRHAERAGAEAVSEARWGPGGTEDSGEYDDEEPEPEPCPLERAEDEARSAAHEVWDDWDERVAAVNDALAAGGLPGVRTAERCEGDPAATPTRVAPAQAGAHPDSPQDADREECAEAAGVKAPHSPDAVTSTSPPEDAPTGELAPGCAVSWAPACAGATGEDECGEVVDECASEGAPSAPVQAIVTQATATPATVVIPETATQTVVALAQAGAHPTSPSQSKRAARRAKARRRTGAASPAKATPQSSRGEFSSCTVPTVSTSREIRPSAPSAELVEVPAQPAEPPAPPRGVPRVHFFDVASPYDWRPGRW